MNQNTEITKLMIKILDVTMEIKDKLPEVYLNLNESFIFDSSDKKKLNLNDFEEYLITIQSHLKKMTIL